MISKTKYMLNDATIKRLFQSAGIENTTDIVLLGGGEYNAVYSVKSNGKEYVVKIAPSDSVPILTYEQGMLSSELFWYKQMKEHTTISIPNIFYSDFSKTLIPTNYFIMEKLKGQQLDKFELTKEEKNCAIVEKAKMLAQIHKIKSDKFGYIQNELFDDWYQSIKAMASAVLADGQRKGHMSAKGRKLLKYIEKHKTILERVECCMVNYDLWDPNIICDRENEKITYSWIDPERSCWGDRIVDFVSMESLSALAGKKTSISAYNSVSDNPITCSMEEKIRFAIAQGYLALILEVEKYYRYNPVNAGWWRNVLASSLLYYKAFSFLR